MELAKHICENLRVKYPNDSFVASTDDSASYGNCKRICDMNGTRVDCLNLSSANPINNSALKSLLHRVVFESKWMSKRLDRAKHISDQIDIMLPAYCSTVFITNVSSNDRPQVFGPHKGLAYFWEPEFGNHVTIILH